ncbi:MAG: phosphohistidine phosphatase SixA [Thermodesulfobacteriota bacterium]
MALYLVQHGKALSKEIDPEKGLSDEGKVEVRHIAEVACRYCVRPAKIRHSGKKRAHQTADIFASVLEPSGGVQKMAGINALDNPMALAPDLQSGDNIMLVSHLPFLEKLTSGLTAGLPEIRVFKFQNGGIVCLDREEDDSSWFIRWSLMPKIG